MHRRLAITTALLLSSTLLAGASTATTEPDPLHIHFGARFMSNGNMDSGGAVTDPAGERLQAWLYVNDQLHSYQVRDHGRVDLYTQFRPVLDCYTFRLDALANDGRTASASITMGDACDELPQHKADFSSITLIGPDPQEDGTYEHRVLFYGRPTEVSVSTDPPTAQSDVAESWYMKGKVLLTDDPFCGTGVVTGLQALPLPDADRTAAALVALDSSSCAPQNQAPSVDLGENLEKLPAKDAVLHLAIDDDDGEHAVTVDWGDGSSEALTVSGGQATLSHAFHGVGQWTIEVCATDAAGESSCDTVQLTQRGSHGKMTEAMHPGEGKAKGAA